MCFLYWLGPTDNPNYEIKVCHLVDLGVQEMDAVTALSSCDWNLEKAMELIINFSPTPIRYYWDRTYSKGLQSRYLMSLDVL